MTAGVLLAPAWGLSGDRCDAEEYKISINTIQKSMAELYAGYISEPTK